MEIAGIYGRSSLGDGRQGETIEHQIQMIQEFAKRSNIRVKFHEKFIYQDEESGYKTTLIQRPSMKRLINDIESGLIQVIFFKGISRFARDSGEAIITAKRLIHKGVRVISLEENYDSIRDDPTMFQIYAVMAEQESRKTSIRVSLGNKQKARNGLWSNSKTPFGYSKVKDIRDEDIKNKALSEGRHPHSLYPNKNAFIVKRMFEMYYSENLGRKQIVNWTAKSGYKTEKGNIFSDKIIKDILTNPAYIGDIVYGKTRYEYIEDEIERRKVQRTIKVNEDDWAVKKNAHPPIVDRELFTKVQIKFRQNEKKFNKKGRYNAAKHPLTGILRCNKCGSPMICQKRTNTKKDGTKLEYRYYVCSTYHRNGRRICDQANVNADILEKTVITYLKQKVQQLKQDLITGRIEREDKTEDIRSQLKSIEQNIKKRIRASAALLENIDMYDEETFRELNNKFKNEIKELRDHKSDLEEKIASLSFGKTQDDLDEIVEKCINFDNLGIDEKRELFHDYVNIVYVKDNEIEDLQTNF